MSFKCQSKLGPLKVNKRDSLTRNQPFLIKAKSLLRATISGAYIFSHVSSMNSFKIILHRATIFGKNEGLPSGYSCPSRSLKKLFAHHYLILSIPSKFALILDLGLNLLFLQDNPKVSDSFSLEITDHACSLACFSKALGDAQQFNKVQKYENTARLNNRLRASPKLNSNK